MNRTVVPSLILAVLLTSCGQPRAVVMGVGVTDPEETVLVEEPAAPHWTVASGSLRQGFYRYRYYRNSNIYFDVTRRLYFYPDATRATWKMTKRLPTALSIREDEMVDLDMANEEPYRYHAEVAGKFPPAKAKRHGKGNTDNRGKGPGEKRDNQGHWD